MMLKVRTSLGFYLLLILIVIFIFEACYCGWNFQIFKDSDSLLIKIFCGVFSLSLSLAYFFIKKKREKTNGLFQIFFDLFYFMFLFYFLLWPNILFLNGFFDGSETESHVVGVEKLESKFGGRSSYTLYLCFPYWGDSYSKCRIQVQPEIFDTVHDGSKIILNTKKGFLGFQWVKEYEILDKNYQ